MAKYDNLPPATRKKLQAFIETSLEECTNNEAMNYDRLVREFAFANTTPQNVWNWLDLLSRSVSKLNFNIHQKVIQKLLSYSWDFPREVNAKFKELLLRLMSADALFTKPALKSAIACLSIEEGDETVASKTFNQDEYDQRCVVVFDFLLLAKTQRPDVGTKLFPILLNKWPHFSYALTCFRAYLSNFFRIIELFPELRYRGFQFLLEKVCYEDQCLSELEEFAHLDKDERKASFDHHLSIVDLLVSTILQQCSEVSNTEELEKIWTFVLNCFERTVLKAPQSRHVQFILFYLCHFRSTYSTIFLDRLVKIGTVPSTPTLVRIASLRYAGGFVGRAKYVRDSDARWAMETMLQWACNYARAWQERYGYAGNIPVHEVEKHQAFYTAIQSIIFIILRRETLDFDDLETSMEIEVEHAEQTLEQRIAEVMNSQLAPLRFVGEQLVQKFLQRIESSSLKDRLPEHLKQPVNAFGQPEFPFDKFELANSKSFFSKIYIE